VCSSDLTVAAGLIIISSVLPNGCVNFEYPNNTPNTTSFSLDQEEQDEWIGLSSIEKIERLEKGKHSLKGTRAKKEMAQAAAEYFSEKAPFLIDASNLDVVFGNFELSPVVFRDGKVFINEDQLKYYVEDLKIQEPAITDHVKGRDLEMVALKSMLFRSFVKTQRTNEKFELQNQEFNLSSQISVFSFNRFDLIGVIKESNEIIVLEGKGPLEYATATIIGKDAGYYIPEDRMDMNAAEAICQINKKASLSPEDFQAYYFGKKPVADLFKKWEEPFNWLNPKFRPVMAKLMFSAIIHSTSLEMESDWDKKEDIRDYVNNLLNPSWEKESGLVSISN